MQSGFPIGVSQNTNNTNLLGAASGRTSCRARSSCSATSPTGCATNPTDDRYLNEAAFAAAPAGTFGNAPRILPGAYSPWRNSTDVAINKDIRFGGGKRATLRLEIINLFDNPWYAAMSSVAFGNNNFGKVESQGNYSQDDADHGEILVLGSQNSRFKVEWTVTSSSSSWDFNL